MIELKIATFAIWQGWTVVGTISAFVAAVATVLYTYYTYHLLSATKASIDIANHNREVSNKLAEFQIYSKIANDLSSPKALELLDKIESIQFCIEESETAGDSSSSRNKIAGRDLRRFILGPIEDLAKFKSDNIISMESIDSGFGNTILMVGSSKTIVEYIMHLRKKVYSSDDIYCGVESLFKEELESCGAEEKVKYKNHFDIQSVVE